VKIPYNMCNQCNLKPYNSRGNFPIRQEIYDIDAPLCKAGIQRYVELNPCDDTRRRQMANFNNPDNHAAIGVFMYSVCETCCDCVPIGARANQFENRRSSETLIELYRGNCPAHAVYDICKIWPNIRATTNPNIPAKSEWVPICPLLRDWLRSPASNGWLRNPHVSMDYRIKRFLRKLNTSAGCRKQHVWQECTRMELAQGRV